MMTIKCTTKKLYKKPTFGWPSWLDIGLTSLKTWVRVSTTSCMLVSWF